jgi:hypothetical protein
VRRSAPDPLEPYASRILAAMKRTVDGIFATAAAIAAAKRGLPHGQWMQLFEERRVPMSISTADRFLAIHVARERLMANSAHGPNLPPSWRTLYELTRLPEDTLTWAQQSGRIHADLERRDISQLRRAFTESQAVLVNEAEDVDANTDRSQQLGALLIDLNTALMRAYRQWPPGTYAVFRQHVESILRRLEREMQEKTVP